MAEPGMTLLTLADLGIKVPGVTIDDITGRKAITLPNGETVELGTTGDRDITSLCQDISAGTVDLIRTGYTVTISFDAVKTAVAGDVSIIPAAPDNFLYKGYRIGVYNNLSFPLLKGNGPNSARVTVDRNGGIIIRGAATTDALYGAITYQTQRAWPSTLSGMEGLINP